MYDSGPFVGRRIYPPRVCAQGSKPHIDCRGGKLLPSQPDLGAISWNVEGLTEEKLEVLQIYMGYMNIGITALQETHSCNSDYY